MRRRVRAARGAGPLLLVLCSVFRAACGGKSLPALNDDIPFRMSWPGPDFSLPTTGIPYKDDNFIIMTTADKETYKCMLPLMENDDQEDENEYKGPTPAKLLEPLFKQSSCSYRIESYWVYEVCHGKHVRQYHEDKEAGQKISVQEYYLGNMVKKSPLEADEKADERESTENSKDIPTKNIEGQMTPYYPVEMGNGTPCVLKQNQPRSSTVLYICHPEAKHEILLLAEVTTCEYEVVILTPLLCNHPKYRFRTSPVNDIFCQAMPGSPLRPQSLEKLEQKQEIKTPVKSSKEEDNQSLRDKFSTIHKPVSVGSQQQVTVGTTHISRLTDDQLIKEFLSGSYCFHGGVGWWKYEFCYGKYVHQYHEDKDTGKTTVVVGTWKKEEHLTWAKKNPARLYLLPNNGKQSVRMVSHFYGGGDLCELNEKPRQVVVKLKCKESESPHAVTVYMLEPQTCQYVLGVESPVICKILDTADENGLLSIPN
uniref:Endoplasmic reticulum lectin n=1 Tax=Leptobrachium leishanense TaxID=445787 RepID=A0A8C5PBS9_9ANUR